MACCLTAQSHCLNQLWLITEDVLWRTPESNLTKHSHNCNPWYVIDDRIFKVLSHLARDTKLLNPPSITMAVVQQRKYQWVFSRMWRTPESNLTNIAITVIHNMWSTIVFLKYFHISQEPQNYSTLPRSQWLWCSRGNISEYFRELKLLSFH